MAKLIQNTHYFASSVLRKIFYRSFVCTNCGSDEFEVVDSKFGVTELRRCGGCRLMYRSPPDDETTNFAFYQSMYEQGFTTELPSDENLRELLATRFDGTEKCYEGYISVLCSLGILPGSRVFDYGCSWGYGSWQLMDAGYKVVAYEISRQRAEFAREKLGVDCRYDLSEVEFMNCKKNGFDCFFSAHVLEHVPKPSRVIELARLALRPGGLFVAFTPNGSAGFRRANFHAWHLLWGKVHPNLIDDRFYGHAFAANEIYLDTTPVNRNSLEKFIVGESVRGQELSGSELLCVAKL